MININMAESSPRRKLAVILATDVVGYSTKMEENGIKHSRILRFVETSLMD